MNIMMKFSQVQKLKATLSPEAFQAIMNSEQTKRQAFAKAENDRRLKRKSK